MNHGTYVNEFDPGAAAWCRELMRARHVPEGVVDERSIAEVQATDVMGYRRAHFFGGILGWELALQLAGWPDERSVWSGSAPCQPFSSAGKRKGKSDERNLWPEFFRLIRECRPPVVFGEQVASSDVVGSVSRKPRKAVRECWVDGVRADLEGAGYTFGAAVVGAHSAGAPHQRQRLYWVAHTGSPLPRHGSGPTEASSREREQGAAELAGRRATRGMADGDQQRREGRGLSGIGREAIPDASGCGATRGMADTDGGFAGDGGIQRGGEHGQQPEDGGVARGVGNTRLHDESERARGEGRKTGERPPERSITVNAGVDSGLGNASGNGVGRDTGTASRAEGSSNREGCEHGTCGVESGHASAAGVAQGDTSSDGSQGQRTTGATPGATLGTGGDFWSDFALIRCRDGKTRRIPAAPQPRILSLFDGLSADVDGVRLACETRFPLAGKMPNRTMLLRGFGNAICVPTAAAFIRAFLEAEAEG